MKNWLRDHGLTLALIGLFALSAAGMAFTGWHADAQSRAEHAVAPATFAAYLASGEFLSALFENWESEFLQMWAYVVLTAYLFQRGSPESKDPDQAAPQDRDPGLDAKNPAAPWPVRAGGVWRGLYAHSLGLALFILFAASFVLHFANSLRNARDEALLHGQPAADLAGYWVDPQFWFESFQNWQSEFMSTAALILLAVVLRERGSPESKPVGAPHAETGTDLVRVQLPASPNVFSAKAAQGGALQTRDWRSPRPAFIRSRSAAVQLALHRS